MFFFGAQSRGKTAGAAYIFSLWPMAYEIMSSVGDKRELRPRFVSAAEMIDDVMNARSVGKTASLRRDVQEASILILDDIVDRNVTDARRAAIFDILEWRGLKPMILTCNFSPPELLKPIREGGIELDSRIFERMVRGRKIEFTGPSLRVTNMTITKV